MNTTAIELTTHMPPATAMAATDTTPATATAMAAMAATDSMATTTAAPVTAAPITAAPAAAMDPDALAAFLAEAAPIAGPLDALACEGLSLTGHVDAVVAWERQLRHTHAGLIRALGSLAHRTECERDPHLAQIEVSAALAWAPTTAQNRLADAEALTRLFPETVQLLSQGKVSIEQARALEELTGGLEDQAAQAVQARVLPRMPGQSIAVTRQAIRRAVLRTDPDAAAKRHEHERTRRRVELRPEDDGMATLSFYLPADIAQMAMRTLTALALSAKRKNRSDKRTLDQRRADLLPVLLHHAATGRALTGSTPTIPAHVNVVVNVETLLNLSHEPGHLDGYGPICPEQTRNIANAHAARWRFLLTATDGTVVDASARTYTPRAAVKRLTQLKYTTCTFPHCRMPAERCDLDHAIPFHKGGPTSVDNLGPLCRTHHNRKSFGDWILNRHGDTITWSSEHTGRTYNTGPTRYPTTQAA
jgi:Domain of unknown function (DUF222)/HNH endonuclease